MEKKFEDFCFNYLTEEKNIPENIKLEITRKIKALLYIQERSEREWNYDKSKELVQWNDCHSTSMYILNQKCIDLNDGGWTEWNIENIVQERKFPYYLCIAEERETQYVPGHSIAIIWELEGFIIYFEQFGKSWKLKFTIGKISDFKSPPEWLKNYWKSMI